MATRRITEYLLGCGARFATIGHSPAYSAQETAESVYILGHCMAKTAVIWIDRHLSFVVIPSAATLDLESICRETGAARARLAAESDFDHRFKSCGFDTVPPFGNVFGMDTYVDVTLTHHSHIAFLAGTHTDVIVLETPDYIRLVHPKLVNLSSNAAEVACSGVEAA